MSNVDGSCERAKKPLECLQKVILGNRAILNDQPRVSRPDLGRYSLKKLERGFSRPSLPTNEEPVNLSAMGNIWSLSLNAKVSLTMRAG